MIGKHAHLDSRDWNYKDRSVVQPTNHNLDSPYHSISVPFVSAPLVSRGTTRLRRSKIHPIDHVWSSKTGL